MLLRRFYDDKLAQASYMVGCQATGEAVVVDPHRDTDVYLEAAEKEGMRIRYVTETHIHADFLSGARQLAKKVGATLLLSDEGGEDWRYGFAAEDGATLLHDGDRIELGRITLEALHTPGHTPEHLSFRITDGAASDRPMGVLTGDFLFVGDVGRPDLLEKAAGVAGTMEAGARVLWASLERFRSMPDYLQILPGHGAGSACGKALGSVPSSTLGYEKLVNWAFQCADEEEFVQEVLADQPEPPVYFAHMKRMNRDGPAVLDRLPEPEAMRSLGRPAPLRRRGRRSPESRRLRRGAPPGNAQPPLGPGLYDLGRLAPSVRRAHPLRGLRGGAGARSGPRSRHDRHRSLGRIRGRGRAGLVEGKVHSSRRRSSIGARPSRPSTTRARCSSTCVASRSGTRGTCRGPPTFTSGSCATVSTSSTVTARCSSTAGRGTGPP